MTGVIVHGGGIIKPLLNKGWVMFEPRFHKREYKSWSHMKGRCYCKTNKKYPSYGGRGIKVCDEWLASFSQFYTDMGDKPSPGMSIERLDNDGDYTPENCVWATPKQQANNRRSNRYLEYCGERKTVSEWAADKGIKPATLRARIDAHGMTVEQALETKVVASKRATYTHNGITDNIFGWSKRLGFGRNTLHERMRRGATFQDAVSAPLILPVNRRAGLAKAKEGTA